MTTILKSKGKADIGRSLLNINTPPALTPQILPPAPRPNATLGSPLTSDITFSPASIVSRDAAASSAAIVSAISSNPSSVLPILGKPALVSDAAITSGPSIGSGKSISTTAGITPGKMTEAKWKDSASAAQHAQPLTTAAAAPTASVSTKQEAVGGTTTKDL